jgi:hypothetical protein
MHVCEKEKNVPVVKCPPLISGHVYTYGAGNSLYLYCAPHNTLINLLSGGVWSLVTPYGENGTTWRDVTEQYCLKKM